MKKITNKTKLVIYTLSALTGMIAAALPVLTTVPSQSTDIKTQDYAQEFAKLYAAKINTASPFKEVVKDISNMEMPTPPEVPSMPNGRHGVHNILSQDATLRVVGLLPPNIAIIQKSGKTITVRKGQDSEYGYIGEITKNGVYIDGTFIEIEF